jgi:hypothetical protein
MNEEKDLSVDTESTDTQQEEVKEKTYTQAEIDDMKAKWESGFQKRLGKEVDRKMKIYEDENFKKDQLIDVLKEQTGRETIDDLLDMSEEQYGVTVQRTRTNKNDAKVLGKHDAKEILDVGDDDFVESEFNRLASRTRTEREEETYAELKSSLDSKKTEAKRKKEIKEKGLDETVVNSEDFKTFEKKFSKDTPISEVYDMYEKVSGVKEEKPFSAGSLKDTKSKQTDEFFSVDEFNALTSKDLDDPKIYEKAMRTIRHNYRK